jgi:hypothetical protein
LIVLFLGSVGATVTAKVAPEPPPASLVEIVVPLEHDAPVLVVRTPIMTPAEIRGVPVHVHPPLGVKIVADV